MRILDEADAAGVAHPGFVGLQVFFGAENPTKGGAHGGGDVGWGCIAVGVDKGTVVFGMLGHEIDEGLKTGAATTAYLDVFGCFDQSLYLAQFYVELYHINLLDAVSEKAVDGGV